ncbi:hypothetical protein BO82DRAFT_402774 [Aspergillus uvarum CBS 121591]|uniref:NAD(P)-binding protein n=1 Tax=Aspergillus uvarum CBS 121591 TaxID=1448315 RepID=A0A319CAT5_9EURO|nr:hypothetical protein BO82DRAFT_402774 [Aspergillus uvarum CBS 121591]PYH81199.1 hypothetical protein BO82DRAFT_402774 [Aspergillus uvarum CBS 121591]
MAQVSSPAGVTIVVVAVAATSWLKLRECRGKASEIAELYRVNDARVAVVDIKDVMNLSYIRATLSQLIHGGKPARIVNISSVVAHLYPVGLSDYACSKTGLNAPHHNLEAETRRLGYDMRTRFFLVEVGQMQTPLFSWIKPPNSVLAPVLEPAYVAQKIYDAVNIGSDGVIQLPKYAS